MSEIISFNRDGIELYINTDTGESFASIRGLSRSIDKPESTVRNYVKRHFKDAQLLTENLSEIPTKGGLQRAQLLNEKQQLEIISKYKPDLLIKISQLGIRIYNHSLAGYKVTSEAIEQAPKTALELAKEQAIAIAYQIKLLEEIEFKNTQIALLEEATERQAEVIDELFDYSSIIRVAKFNGCSEKIFSWHALKAASKTLDLEIKVAPCPRFGTKNLYHHGAWKMAYPGYVLPENNAIVAIPSASIENGGF